MTFFLGIWKFLVGGGWKWLLIISIISFLGYFARDVYNDYQDQIAQMVAAETRAATLERVNAVNEATIAEMERRARENEINRQILQESNRQSRQRVSELESLLSRHNLEFLALNKPGLIERRINDATDEAFSDISCLTDPNCLW